MNVFTILILEDEYFIAKELKIKAEEGGYQVIMANTSEEALKAIENEHFDLALLDIKLQGETRTGIDVAKAIRQKNLRIPIIFLSAFSNDREIKTELEKIDYADFLKKGTFDLDLDLLAKVEHSVSTFFDSEKGKTGDLSTDWLSFNGSGKFIINCDVFLRERDDTNPEKVNIRRKKRRILLAVDEVDYIIPVDGRAKLITDKGVFEISVSLTDIIDQLQQGLPADEHGKLFRAHKSSIVNPSKIVAYDKISGVHYVYFKVDDLEEQGVPVKPEFIALLEGLITTRIRT